MEETRRAVIVTAIITAICWSAGLGLVAFTSKPEPPPSDKVVEYVVVEPAPINWDLFVEALIEQESKGDDKAVGKTDDAGCLQFTPIAVKDVNRILGYNKYTLEDRFNRKKSIEMFNIQQAYYNPKLDPHLALKIHNPKAPVDYHTSVMRIYYRLLLTNN